jgi:hypothetical protein
MSIDGTNNNAMGTGTNSLLLQKFLNGDVDLRSIEQRDLRVYIISFLFVYHFILFFSSVF